jgi:Spy/CpxP family protein refolding chaperone
MELKDYLNLSDTQIAALETVRQTAREANRPLAEQLRARREGFGAGDTISAQSAQEMAALRLQLQTARARSRAEAMALLTPEQKARLKALAEAAALRPVIEQAHSLKLLLAPPHRPGNVRKNVNPE